MGFLPINFVPVKSLKPKAMSSLIKKTENFPYFGSLFDDFFSKDVFDWNAKNFSQMGSTLPSVNVKETESDFQVELAAPGMKKEDFKIELNNHILSISSEKKTKRKKRRKSTPAGSLIIRVLPALLLCRIQPQPMAFRQVIRMGF